MTKSKGYSRREFLHTSAAGLAAGKVAAATHVISPSPGAGETVRLALIGCSGQGVYDLQECLDSRDTPDTLEAIFDFPGFTLTYSCRHANAFPSGSLTRGGRTDHGIQFFGAEATLLVDRSGYQIIPEGKNPEPIFSPPGLDADAARLMTKKYRAPWSPA